MKPAWTLGLSIALVVSVLCLAAGAQRTLPERGAAFKTTAAGGGGGGGTTNITNGLALWWTFDDTLTNFGASNAFQSTASGTAVQYSTGTISNAVRAQAGATDTKISFPPFTYTNSTGITLAFWLKPDIGSAAYGTIIGFPGSAQGLYWFPSASSLTWYVSGDHILSAVATNVWTHWVLDIDTSGVLTAYTNASTVTAGGFTFPGGGGATWSLDSLLKDFSVDWFQGELDDFRLYLRRLSADERTNLYNWRGEP